MRQPSLILDPDVRAAKGTIPAWIIAVQLQISETTLRNWLRREMPGERRNKVLEAIKEVKTELVQYRVTKITKDSRPAAV